MKARVTGASVTQDTENFSPLAQKMRITLACGHSVIEDLVTFRNARKNKKWPCRQCEAMRRNRK